MNKPRTHRIFNYLIATVWIANGLFCKLLNLVPRHQQIIAGILGNHSSQLFTRTIGVLEIGMALWILSGIRSRLNAITQIIIILTMNALEVAIVPDLLLWGKFNAFFALLLCGLIYYNEFIMNKKPEKS